jgi:hypothetical protein
VFQSKITISGENALEQTSIFLKQTYGKCHTKIYGSKTLIFHETLSSFTNRKSMTILEIDLTNVKSIDIDIIVGGGEHEISLIPFNFNKIVLKKLFEKFKNFAKNANLEISELNVIRLK